MAHRERGSGFWQMAGGGERSIRQWEPGVHRKLPDAGWGWNIKWVMLKQRLKCATHTHREVNIIISIQLREFSQTEHTCVTST